MSTDDCYNAWKRRQNRLVLRRRLNHKHVLVEILGCHIRFALRVLVLGRKIEVARGDWRPGDQKVFYANIYKAERELGWKPQIGVERGVEMLFEWVNGEVAQMPASGMVR